MNRSIGFTLLEILIALFIFTIVSLIMTSALHNVFNVQSATDKRAELLSKLQVSILMMSRDIEQTIGRPITNSAGTLEGFTGSPSKITFTRAGFENPFGQLDRSTLQRVSYQINDNHLVRVTWMTLDQASKTSSDQRKLIDNISDLHFEYLDAQGRFQKQWPPDEHAKLNLPRAVRVTLTLSNWGKISQLFLIPGQSLDQSQPK